MSKFSQFIKRVIILLNDVPIKFNQFFFSKLRVCFQAFRKVLHIPFIFLNHVIGDLFGISHIVLFLPSVFSFIGHKSSFI